MGQRQRPPYIQWACCATNIADENLAQERDVEPDLPIKKLIERLVQRDVYEEQAASGFRKITDLGHQAAHGKPVDPGAAEWVQREGRAMIDALDPPAGLT